jgi:hypothetical protein
MILGKSNYKYVGLILSRLCRTIAFPLLSMLWLSAFVVGLVTVQFSIAKPLTSKRWNDLAIKHAWVETPRGWEFHSTPPEDHLLDMRIGLKQNKLDELIASLYEVSDPAHERYAVWAIGLVLPCS